MNRLTIIKKCSEITGYNEKLIELAFDYYWQNMKDKLQNPTHTTVMLEFIGKFQMLEPKLEASIRFQEKQLRSVEKKLEVYKNKDKQTKMGNIIETIKKNIKQLEPFRDEFTK